MRRAGAAGADFEPRHRGDRGQRLAAEAEGGDLHEVAVGNFRCRVPFDGKGEIGFVQPMPVVDDPDEPSPAGLDRDLDRFRASVERVLDQFLDRRRRPLDHLARGDAVDGQGVKTANWHGGANLESTIAFGGGSRKRPPRFKGAARRPDLPETQPRREFCPNESKKDQIKTLAFPWISLVELGLFNGLWHYLSWTALSIGRSD